MQGGGRGSARSVAPARARSRVMQPRPSRTTASIASSCTLCLWHDSTDSRACMIGSAYCTTPALAASLSLSFCTMTWSTPQSSPCTSLCFSAASALCVPICSVPQSRPTITGISCTTIGVVSAALDRTTSLMASNACVCTRTASASSTGRDACAHVGGARASERAAQRHASTEHA